MKNILDKNLIKIIIIIATVILGGVAIYTGIRLYQLRQESVAPTAPESEPAAADMFEKVYPSTPAPTSVTGGVGGGTPTSTGTCVASLTVQAATEAGATATPEATASPSPTATPRVSIPSTETGVPEAGTTLPTVVGIGTGILLLLGAILFLL